MRFIDLFAGIGGFHQAMKYFDGELVLAAEIDQYAKETYANNYGINFEDIVNVKEIDEEMLNERLRDEDGGIVPVDILCAGFPCQSFSKAGNQNGFEDETRGTLFFDIERILRIMIDLGNPIRYILLENVANIVSHDEGKTYDTIISHLCNLGYRMNKEPIILSPHQIGVPQLRSRAFFLGVYDLECAGTPENQKPIEIELNDVRHGRNITDCNIILDSENCEIEQNISETEILVLDAWNFFYTNINANGLGFPIWVEYLNDKPIDLSVFPTWKASIIEKNRILYRGNQEMIRQWILEYGVDGFTNTHKKFEWQAGNDIENLWEGIIQFRPSGIRVKRPTEFPALVAMVQIPIIGRLRRRLTINEIARLQSFPIEETTIETNFGNEVVIPPFRYNENEHQSLKQFGNSVNVQVIKYLIEKLINIM